MEPVPPHRTYVPSARRPSVASLPLVAAAGVLACADHLAAACARGDWSYAESVIHAWFVWDVSAGTSGSMLAMARDLSDNTVDLGRVLADNRAPAYLVELVNFSPYAEIQTMLAPPRIPSARSTLATPSNTGVDADSWADTPGSTIDQPARRHTTPTTRARAIGPRRLEFADAGMDSPGINA